MAYGILKCDNITFDNGGSDQNVTVSGLYRATTSGVTLSGTIAATTVSGVTVIGSTTVSGATVTGTTANFTSGNFGNIISSAATMSGALIMANQQQVRFREAVGNGVNHIALQAPAIVSADQTITLPDQTGTVITTGDNGSVSSTMLATNLTISAAAGSAATPSIAFTGDLNTGIYSPGADQLAVATNGTGRLFIDGTGYVGIGTVPSVGFGLDIRGLTRILSVGGASGLEIGTGTATNQFASLDLVGDATYVDYGLRILRGDSGANAESNIAHKGTGALSLITEEAAPIVLATSNAERLRVTSAGNVGIGTSTPGDLLVVAGQVTSVLPFGSFAALQTAGGTGFRWLLNNDGTFRLQRTTDGFSTATTPIFFSSSNQIGIGTTSPSQALDVGDGNITLGSTLFSGFGVSTGDVAFEHGGNRTGSGNVYIDLHAVSGGDFQSRILRDGGANGAFSIVNNGTGNFVITQANAAAITFGIDNSERARIDSSGRLLVGTSTAQTSRIVGSGTNSATPALQTVGNSISTASALLGDFNTTTTHSSELFFNKSASSTVGTNTIVTSGHRLGRLSFAGGDGAVYLSAATIEAIVDGTPVADTSMPGRLVFSTTADGASTPTERMRIRSDGNIGIGGTGDASVSLYNQAAITGNVNSYANYTNATVQSDVTTAGYGYFTTLGTAAASFTTTIQHFSAGQAVIGSGSTVSNQYGFVANASLIGATNNYGFLGNIASGTGRYNFFGQGTAPNYFNGDLRTNTVVTSRAAPANSNTSATATASSLLDGLRTGTPTGNITLTLPTGTDMDAAFQDLQGNQSFQWSVINLAAATHLITVTAAATGHTVTGNMEVAAASSGRFLTRKTGANTFASFRIA